MLYSTASAPRPDDAHAPSIGTASLVDVFINRRAQLRHLAKAILGNAESADDLVQDACMRAITTAVGHVADPVAYAFGMVRNMAFDVCRRSALESRLFQDDADTEFIEAATGTPERVAMDRQHLHAVMRVLADLPERTRHVVEMCRIDGHSQRDIAQRLNVSPTFVHFLVRDAVARCRAAIA